MKINISRFYKRERRDFDCEILTPMFLGNANQEAELRAAPFKGLLRYWWRVANGLNFQNGPELLKAENEIFGSPDEVGGKSRVTVEVKPLTAMLPHKENFSNPGDIDHPECERSRFKTNPLNYLAGMGLIHFRNGVQHSYFRSGERFMLSITASRQIVDEIDRLWNMIILFGTVGSRCRNGWGSFENNNHKNDAQFRMRNFSEAFDRDYPHCLGKDSVGSLFWKTNASRDNWRNCMRDLAQIYVSIRVGNKQENIPKIEVNRGSPPERHLLGYPVTNHSVKLPHWGNQGRHGSALRLIVRKDADGYRGYILHLPHLFSKEMWSGGKERQIKIWEQVHAGLDKLCQRVELQEDRS